MATKAILAIDEGTTNSKVVLVNAMGEIIASGAAPVPIEHPKSGWVQQDANEIWSATKLAIKSCLAKANDIEIVGLGISNQRESILIWDRKTGTPLGPIISWQCRRTAAKCDALRQDGYEPNVIAKTGLPLDPMFPPTKVAWLLENHGKDTADICVGTVDSWLIWKLSGGKTHASDRSNAARTQLFNLADGQWDKELCALFGIDIDTLPAVYDSSHIFGETHATGVLPDGIPIASAIGDSHAALFGHGAFHDGDGKITFGTGSSVMTTLPEFITPPDGITTTIAWSLNGRSTYAFEGNILVSAAIFPWAADMLGLSGVEELIDLAQTVEDSDSVCLVPAHVGLGSPHWASQARGLVSGLSFNSKPAHMARAATDSVAHQVADVLEVIKHTERCIGRLFIDGGPSNNKFLMQCVANSISHSIIPCRNTEASALGAAHLAGLSTGFWPNLEAVASLASHGTPYKPKMPAEKLLSQRTAWREAVARTVLRV
ncbi:FGGY family carbohydrate kinase [Ahrensia kielensis]|uniref:FGGY family carbohydrate kinase n=1 Tax=Ahrensia kielensis TaxID=76980 RepID=UPI00036304A7|nr:FGGY-family carbohydrate kinase [Ahrensia kielensis]